MEPSKKRRRRRRTVMSLTDLDNQSPHEHMLMEMGGLEVLSPKKEKGHESDGKLKIRVLMNMCS